MRLPEWLEPMAATLTAERFVDPAWTFERKLDGIRMLALSDGRCSAGFASRRRWRG
jgi:ATP-dependent DNA ligase